LRGPVLAPDITTGGDRGPQTIQPRTAPATLQSRTPPAPPAPARPASNSTSKSILEARHPEIARAVSLLWGYPEMNEYFDRLWLSDGSQGPIDPDAMSELMLLARVHQTLLPQRPGRSLASIYGGNRMYDNSSTGHDPWSDVPSRR